jgi:hypothetical protein
MKRVIGFSRPRACCPVVALTTPVSFDFVHKIGGRRHGYVPLLQLLSKSKAIFTGIADPCWHLDERAAKRFRVFPIYSRRDLAAFGVDNSQTNRLRVTEIFLLDLNGVL